MLTFDDCLDLMSRRNGCKKLRHNTWLKRLEPETFGVLFHNTIVVKIHKDGTYTLNSGRWRTATTKSRINQYAPVHLFQKDWTWFLEPNRPFADLMVVDNKGHLLTDKGELVMDVESNPLHPDYPKYKPLTEPRE